MNFAFFVHALASDWNHGNAHFLRGVCSEIVARGHTLDTHEQQNNWSTYHLESVEGVDAKLTFEAAYPSLAGVAKTFNVGGRSGTFADPDHADVEAAEAALSLDDRLKGIDVVVVHEWTPPSVVAAIGRHRKAGANYQLWFHDTHHRAVSEPEKMARFDISNYDGVLVFGEVLREAYLKRGWDPGRVVTWHEAADIRKFTPEARDPQRDLVWVGNWGDGERTKELHDYLLDPAQSLGLSGEIRGVRYPDEGKAAVEAAGLSFKGYVPNQEAPALFAKHKMTAHVPRRWYVTHLPGIPTIRVFEALACGLPLVSAPWKDTEGLFTIGRDFLMVDSPAGMTEQLRRIVREPSLASDLAAQGLETIKARHTCGHRVDELLEAVENL